jgi:hypothetical protein
MVMASYALAVSQSIQILQMMRMRLRKLMMHLGGHDE